MHRSRWSETNQKILARVLSHDVFRDHPPVNDAVHVLDLHEDGAVLPHVDSKEFVSLSGSATFESHPGGRLSILHLRELFLGRYNRCRPEPCVEPNHAV